MYTDTKFEKKEKLGERERNLRKKGRNKGKRIEERRRQQ